MANEEVVRATDENGWRQPSKIRGARPEKGTDTMANYWTTFATGDLERSRGFYEALGFEVRPGPEGVPCFTAHPAEGATICFFAREAFAAMVPGEVCDAAHGQETVQSLGLGSRDEVDRLLARAESAGASRHTRASEQPNGYGGGFSDPDGHAWAVLHLGGKR
ncbi:MAG: hypothetical protein KF901_13155 [Myxococcales bacterium]|nr:hypothetical protein [Myxococcales bacterium]